MKKLLIISILVFLISIVFSQEAIVKQLSGEPFLLYNTHAFAPAGEDNDGLAEGGETISMPINIYNSGTDTARNISAIITCTHADITIIDNQSAYANISSDENVWSYDSYTFFIAEDCEQQLVEFELHATSDEGSWSSVFDVEIFPANIETSPILLYNTHAYNPAGEDDDGVVESGETISMPINIFNSGNETATNINAQLMCSDPDINILISSQNYSNIESDGNTWSLGNFSFSVEEEATEHEVEFILDMTSDEGTWTSTFYLTIYPQSIEPQPFLLYNTHSYNPAGEDNDGIVESGESIIMPVNIYNSGTSLAQNISGNLICTDPDITITSFQDTFENLDPDQDGWGLSGFAFEVSEDCEAHEVSFTLEINANEGSWTSTFYIEVYEQTTPPSPHLIYNTHAYNPAGADDDGVVESGESISMPINIYNSGTDTARNISAALYCNNPNIDITNSQSSFSNFASDEDRWSENDFTFNVNENAEEQEVEFELVISSDESTWTNDFSINIYPQSQAIQPNLIYNTHIYNPAGDDNDGIVESGESIMMPINIFNSGTDTARNIIAILSCNDPDIILTDDQKSFGNMGSDQNLWSNGAFGFDVSEDCEEHEIEFSIVITSDEGSWNGTFLIEVYQQSTPLGPNLFYNNHSFDPAGEDNDGLAEGGESIVMPISIYNGGTDTARHISAQISCLDPDITITSGYGNYNDVSPNAETWSLEGFTFDIAHEVEEHEAEFLLEIASDEGSWTSTFMVEVYPPDMPFIPHLLYHNHAFTSAGSDNDNFPEGGEHIIMPVSIFNSDTETARGISALILCSDPDITMISDYKTFNDILPDTEGWSNGGYEFTIDENCLEHEVSFVFIISTNDESWSETFTIHIYPKDAFGISEQDENHSIIYPNPNDGTFNITTENISHKTSYQILNSAGQLIGDGQILKNDRKQSPVNLKNLEHGMYLLRLIENNQSIDYKFIVQ